VLAAGFMILMVYVDYTRSLVTACLVGILATALPRLYNVRLQALSFYLLAQLAVYLPVVAVGTYLFDSMISRSGANVHQLPNVALAVGTIGLLLVVLREGIIRLLWRWLTRQLNGGLEDIAR
jgi:hypothetical protein